MSDYRYSITVREIVDAVPGAIFVTVPDEWFNEVPEKMGVFDAFYSYLVDEYGIDKNKVLDSVHIGDVMYGKLQALLRARIKKEYRLNGEELDREVSFASFNSGPHTLLMSDVEIIGDDAVVLEDKGYKTPQSEAVTSLWWDRLQNRNARLPARLRHFGKECEAPGRSGDARTGTRPAGEGD